MKKTIYLFLFLMIALLIGIKASYALAIPGTISTVVGDSTTDGDVTITEIDVMFTASETTTLSGGETWQISFNEPTLQSTVSGIVGGNIATPVGTTYVTTSVDGSLITGAKFAIAYSGDVVSGEQYKLFTINVINSSSASAGGTIAPSNESFYARSLTISGGMITEEIVWIMNTDQFESVKSHDLTFYPQNPFNIDNFAIGVTAAGAANVETVEENGTLKYNISYDEAVNGPRFISAIISYPISYYFSGDVMDYELNNYSLDEPSGNHSDYVSSRSGYLAALTQKTYLDNAHYGLNSDSYVRYNSEEDTYTFTLSFHKNPMDWTYMEDQLNNLPNVNAISGILTPQTQGVRITRMLSENGEFNPNTGAFEADFSGEPTDLVFEVEITDYDAIEDHTDAVMFSSDAFAILVTNIKYVAEGYLADEEVEYYANPFNVLFMDKPIVLGDWNDDGEFNLVDIVRYRMYLANVERIVTLYNNLSDKQKEYLDFNKNDELDLSDLIYARKVIVGIITCQGLTCTEPTP